VAQMAAPADGPLHPAAVVAAVARHLVPDAVVSLDVGNNAFWFSRFYRGPNIRLLLSGHWRTVGFGLPGGIGAKLAEPARQVVVFAGDGGYAEEESLQRRTGRRPFGTRLHNPDWAAYARACGAEGYRVDTYEQLTAALAHALPRLAEGQVAVLDVGVAAVEPRHAQPGSVPARDERPLAAAGAARP